MARKKRYFEKKPDSLKGTGYDSMLEKNLHEDKLAAARFHDRRDRISYTIPHTYEPDFVIEKGDKKFIIETKGRFRDSQEARKYLFVREVLKDNEELVFIFQDPTKPMPFAQKRKDGTKRSHGEWAEKNGFRYWSQISFKEEFLYDK